LRWAVGVDGPDRRENEASSFYNLAEVDRIVSLIEALLAERGTRPPPLPPAAAVAVALGRAIATMATTLAMLVALTAI
jgi:hypothetical protein